MATFRIRTPHAAVKIWNYLDRIEATGAAKFMGGDLANAVSEEIISTISCSMIQTQKTKADPVGAFNFMLAPTRNWTATITPGSWCVIMMSNDPITKEDFKTANPKLVKMVGKIDTVRTQVSVNADGSRSTQFFVSGQDWGHIFQNILYVDPLIMDQAEKQFDQGTALYAHLVNVLQVDGTPQLRTVKDNLTQLLGIFGRPLVGIEGVIDRLGKNTHSLLIPEGMREFFGLEDREIMKDISLVSGALQNDQTYSDVKDGLGWVNPYSLAGSHSMWQVLQDNANHCLNEMYTDILWDGGKAKFALVNRVRPFAFREAPTDASSAELRSLFKYVPYHRLDDLSIISVNAGTNWRDKYNFIEVKPEVADFQLFDNWVKQKAQIWDKENNDVFNREGFRPLILPVKQMPVSEDNQLQADIGSLSKWTPLLQEWYFDTHRLLNGQLAMTGSTEYISVGNNIMFDAGLIGVKANYNSGAADDPSRSYFVLAHVESVKHAFQVDDSGARSYQTVINFVRGIIVDEQRNLVGEGVIDQLSTSLGKEASRNDISVVATSSETVGEKG